MTIQKEIADGHIIVWTFGKTTLAGKTKTLQHIADSSAAENGTIHISYTEKTAQILTVNFDESLMTVKVRQTGQLLSSGAQVEEGTETIVEAQSLPAGQMVDTWTIGKSIEASYHKNQLSYRVDPADAENGTIHISYTTKPE